MESISSKYFADIANELRKSRRTPDGESLSNSRHFSLARQQKE